MTVHVDIQPDLPAVADAAARRFVSAVSDALENGQDAHVVVTGGSTGIAVLRAIRERAASIDWTRVHIWWGDERYVPAGDPDRNDRQADEALLDHVAIDPANVHRVPAADGAHGDDVDAAAAQYAAELERYATDGASSPTFAVLMLGVGEEGHTASIFPHSDAARDHRPVCAVRDCPKPPPTRVSMTFGVLSHATEVWMMTTGAGKAEPVASAVAGADRLDNPAAGPRGQVATWWLIDRAAAALLPDQEA